MAYRKLGRQTGHRNSLFRSQVTALFEHGRMVTTHAKAKEATVLAEQLITLAKVDSVSARRQAAQSITSDAVVRKLFDTIAPRYKERQGGYTRILKVGPRRGDAAPMVILELV